MRLTTMAFSSEDPKVRLYLDVHFSPVRVLVHGPLGLQQDLCSQNYF